MYSFAIDKAVESILLLRTFPKAVSSPFDLIFWSAKVYVNFGRAKHLLRLEDVKFAHQIDQRLRRTLITLLLFDGDFGPAPDGEPHPDGPQPDVPWPF